MFAKLLKVNPFLVNFWMQQKSLKSKIVTFHSIADKLLLL